MEIIPLIRFPLNRYSPILLADKSYSQYNDDAMQSFLDNKTYFETSLVYDYQASEQSFDAACKRANDTLSTIILSQRPRTGVPAKTALDLGCGPGAYSHALCMAGYQVTAIDYCKSFIDIARRNLRDFPVVFRTMDIREIASLIPASFDLIVCTGDTLLYLENKQEIRAVLGAARTLLEPDGRIFCRFRTFPMFTRPGKISIVKNLSDVTKTLSAEFDGTYVYTTDTTQNPTTGKETQGTSRKLRMPADEFLTIMQETSYRDISCREGQDIATFIATRS